MWRVGLVTLEDRATGVIFGVTVRFPGVAVVVSAGRGGLRAMQVCGLELGMMSV